MSVFSEYPDIVRTLSQSSNSFEQAMDALHRKQTGSYYTDLELTVSMMQELVDSLTDDERSRIYTKRFLEPCVGTGNFVFAYILVCSRLGFTKEQYYDLIDNIYVCDINMAVLEVYKRSLAMLVSSLFEIELDRAYFDSHIGSGLLVDVDAEKQRYIPIEHVFPPAVINRGFDIIATNPPFKNLRAEHSHYSSDEEYQFDKEKYKAIGRIAAEHFFYSTAGTINLYKLFVEEIVERYACLDGIISLLIPASILSDKMCGKLRSRLLESTGILSIKVIGEDSNYVDASQALCAFLLRKGSKSNIITIDGSFSGNTGTSTRINVSDIIDERTGNAILVLSPHEYRIRKQMLQHPMICQLPYICNMRGELDITFNKNAIVHMPTEYKLFRGRNISHYVLRETNDSEYVSSSFVAGTAKSSYIRRARIACQQIVNIAKKRRIAFAPIPQNSVLANSCNFIAVNDNDDDVDEYFLLGVLNSPLMDWFFKLTSSNNHINNYEIDQFPIPISYQYKHEISELVKAYLSSPSDEVMLKIDGLVHEAYGISTNAEQDNAAITESVATDNRSENTLTQQLFADLQFLLPGITISDCGLILSEQASIDDFVIQMMPNANKFEKTVLHTLETKYRLLNSGIVLNHTTFKLSALDLEMIRSVPQGGSWRDIPDDTVKKSKRLLRITQTGGRTTLYGRIDYSKPSYTITTYFSRPGNGTYVHPVHERVLSVREAARFQTFPDSYFFYGSKSDYLNQVGNAVPVLLAYSIAKSIIEKTGCHISVDLFSGAGGMTYGFKLAGIHAVIANDFDECACITLKTNSPEISVLCGDITEEKTKQAIVQAGINGKADIICGGPPCQGFSMAGFRDKNDPRNQMFRHFVEIVSHVNPKVIVFENVEGLLSYQNGETYGSIIQLFSELGYHAEGRTLMANEYGVPQRRKRVIILCTHIDLNVLPSDIFPEKLTPLASNQSTAFDAISDLEGVDCDGKAKYIHQCVNNPLLGYFRGEITAEEYIEKIRKSGLGTSIQHNIDQKGEKGNVTYDKEAVQLSIFDYV